MKKNYILLIAFTLAMMSLSKSYATIHVVTVNDASATPTSFNAAVGDTVKWVLQSDQHNIDPEPTSATTPNQADSWDLTLDGANGSSVIYKITVPGSYTYTIENNNEDTYDNIANLSFTVTIGTSPDQTICSGNTTVAVTPFASVA